MRTQSIIKPSFSERFLHGLALTILYILLLVFALFIGLFIGFVLFGKGNFFDFLNLDTWRNIIHFVR
ncbi:DNA-directed RNA polymerase subunit beta [Dolosicoccus paucivorans]|uniref:DNA-directed RNA polymerase subunit beta n=1 Tax=Dolosicoccus paucivorans TaxID=84521 RepID=A0A2N6SP78_9LACT|nr:DNA-directed RNA polymerase subunit beta [Dolosicoccus paucivorans]PMC58877.1 DNA-directed RNA polymerase subunit beta [Dolosicoccus paucivorans]